jgi:F-type H+-transporting ATPase subunit 8
MAGMPQLVPFYFINEVATAFIIIPTIIYLMTKYFLPQTVRTKLARLFISKL